MDIKPIKTDAGYQAALNEIESLMMAALNTPEGEKLDAMVTLIEAYEAKYFPMALPNPLEAIKFEMERKGFNDTDSFRFILPRTKDSHFQKLVSWPYRYIC